MANFPCITIAAVLVALSKLHTSMSSAVEKVAIVGCGTGGLALAATLNRIGSGVREVALFEERSSAVQVQAGGGIQLSGGAVILDRLGCSLLEYGVRLKKVSSRNHFGDWVMHVDLEKAVRTYGPSLLSSERSSQPMLFTLMRETLQKMLYDAATTPQTSESGCSVRIVTNKKCTSITESRANTRAGATVHFSDGSQEAGFDLVVGADGVNSVVRRHVEGIAGPKPGSAVARPGLRIAYCVTPPAATSSSANKGKTSGVEEDGVLQQWFGDGLYVLLGTYGGLSGAHRMLAVVYHANSARATAASAGAASWDATNSAARKESQVQEMRRRLEYGQLGGKADILAVLEAATAQGGRLFDVAVKERLLPLRSWSSDSGRVILLGDAAHPMSPFLGQGANQALQDAYCLGTLIKRTNAKHGRVDDLSSSDRPLRDIARRYQCVRQPPTALLSLESSFLGQLETARGPVGGFLRDYFLRGMSATGLAGLAYVTSAVPRVG